MASLLNFQIRFVNGSNSVLLPITCTFKALKTFLPELLPFNFLFSVTRRSRSDESHLLSHLLSVLIDFTDVTLVSDDTNRRLY